MDPDDARLRVLYDGECRLCTRSVRWIERLDRHARTHCVPLQGTDPPPGRTRADVEREIHAVEPDGRITAGWPAVLEIARRLPLLSWLPILNRVPGVDWLGRRLYEHISSHRTCADCVKDPMRSER